MPGCSTTQRTRARDDFGYFCSLTIGHDVHTCNAVYFLELLNHLHTDIYAFLGLVTSLGDSLQDMIGNLDAGDVDAHPFARFSGSKRSYTGHNVGTFKTA